jgi:hypothetical protein
MVGKSLPTPASTPQELEVVAVSIWSKIISVNADNDFETGYEDAHLQMSSDIFEGSDERIRSTQRSGES